MNEPKQPNLTLFMIPLLVFGAVFITQQFAPKPSDGTATGTGVVADTIDGAAAGTETVAGASAAATSLSKAERDAAEKVASIETDQFVVTFTNLNTAVRSLEVKGARYEDEGKPHNLVTTDKENYLPLAFSISGFEVPQDAVWQLTQPDPRTVLFSWSNDTHTITRRWHAPSEDYQLVSTIEVTNNTNVERPAQLALTSAHYVTREQEKGGYFGRPSAKLSHGICRQAEDTVREPRKELVDEPVKVGPDVDFVALTNVYFGVLMAPSSGKAETCELVATDRGGTAKDPDGSLFEATMRYPTQAIGPGKTVSFGTAAYVGPKNVAALERFGRGSTDVIDLGWFSFIARGMNWLLRTIHGYIGNWGLAIILLTVFVRLLLLPFVIPQFRNMAKQRALKPEIDRINELYKDDREKKGAAMMELWRKEKVNPLGGCLPVLLQMPIFFALYQSLSTNIELYHAPFVAWWQDLSSPDPFYVLPILLGLLMVIQQKLTPIQMDPMQAKVMMFVMPVMMTFFMLLLPTGLCLYMVTSMALGIAQQRYMYWSMDKENAAKTLNEDAAEDDPAIPPTELSPATQPGSSGANKGTKARRKKR